MSQGVIIMKSKPSAGAQTPEADDAVAEYAVRVARIKAKLDHVLDNQRCRGESQVNLLTDYLLDQIDIIYANHPTDTASGVVDYVIEQLEEAYPKADEADAEANAQRQQLRLLDPKGGAQ
jgi:hypothetical protein